MGANRLRQLTLVVVVGAAACHHRAAAPPVTTPPAAPPPAPPPIVQRTRRGALTPTERDSIVAEAQRRRAEWRARGITRYRLTVAVGCFCPWPDTPGVIEVRGGKVVALRDTAGKSLGAVREPWSIYTVEGLFDMVEQGARRDDVLAVAYDSIYGFPAHVRGDLKLGLPDDWFWVIATHLVPQR